MRKARAWTTKCERRELWAAASPWR
jgi:hypothetical protein